MSTPLNLPPIHHHAYVVDKRDAAARRLHPQYSAGPFFYRDYCAAAAWSAAPASRL